MIYAFGDYELDSERFELRHGATRVHVEPQVLDVLAYLIANRGRLVTREELLAQVWGHPYVSDATVSSRLMAARRAVGDTGRTQSLIRTVRGRGYQFTGAVTERATSGVRDNLPRRASDLVGRDDDLERLDGLLELALQGRRQLVLLTGEGGAGKTTLAENFIARVSGQTAVRFASARCLETRGPAEPYMPVLEALTRLGRGPARGQLVEALTRLAPSWLAQLPALVDEASLGAARARALGAGPERMLREMVDALEALAAETPFVLFLDDLQWSDGATVMLLAHLARRDEPAPLLVLGAARPGGDSAVRGLLGELRPRGLCVEVPVGPLSAGDVQDHLLERVPGAEALAPLVHARTDGNPLFVRCLVDWWLQTAALVREDGVWRVCRTEDELARDVPESLRRLLEQEVEGLSDDDAQILEAAACAGVRFSAASAAAGTGRDAEDTEERCAELSRRSQFLARVGVEEWPDGTVASRFAFVHDLHRQVLYERIPAARRRRLHRDIGTRLETAYADGAPARATELAAHFVQARERGPAVRYLKLAADQAFDRGAYDDGIRDLQEAVDLLAAMPASTDRDRRLLDVQAALGGALLAMGSWPEAEPALRGALGLARRLSDTPTVASLLYELAGLAEFRGQYSTTAALLDEALGLEDAHADPARLVERHELMACSLFHQAAFEASIEHADSAFALDRPEQLYPLPALYGEHPAISACGWAAFSLWSLGSHAAALERVDTAIELAGAPTRQYALARAHIDAAQLHQLRRQPERVLEHARLGASLAAERGYAYQAAIAKILLGWALSALGQREAGLQRLRRGLDAFRATGAGADAPYYLSLLAEAAGGEEGLAVAGEALGTIHPDRPFFFDAELLRLHGELVLAVRGEPDRATDAFRRALAVARGRGARSLELRAAISLARLLRDEGRTAIAADVLREPMQHVLGNAGYGDLREARALMAELSRSAT